MSHPSVPWRTAQYLKRPGPWVPDLLLGVLSFSLTIGWMRAYAFSWVGVWSHTGQEVADSMTLIWPLAATWAAWAGVRVRHSQQRLLLDSAGRIAALVWGRLLWRSTAAIAAGWLVAVVIMSARTQAIAEFGSPPIAVYTLALLSIVVVAALGVVVGVTIPHPLSPVSVALLSLIGPYYAIEAFPSLVIPDQLWLTYERKTSAYLVGQSFWLVGWLSLALAAMARQRNVMLVSGCFVLGMAIFLSGVSVTERPAAASAEICSPSTAGPEVCTSATHSYLLPEMVAIVDDFHPQIDGLYEVKTYRDVALGDPESNSTVFPLITTYGDYRSVDMVDPSGTKISMLNAALRVFSCPLAEVDESSQSPDADSTSPLPTVLTPIGELYEALLEDLGIERIVPSYQDPRPPGALNPGVLDEFRPLSGAQRIDWLAERRENLICPEPEAAGG